MSDHITKTIVAMARAERIAIIREERKRWRDTIKRMTAGLIVGFSPIFPREISSIVASYIRVPLSEKSNEAAKGVNCKYKRLADKMTKELLLYVG